MPTTPTANVTKSKPSMGCAYVLGVIIAMVGAGLLMIAGNLYRTAGGIVTIPVAVVSVLGLGILASLLPYMKMARRTIRESEEEEARRLQFPGQPWKWKKEWLAPALEAKAGTGAATLWVFSIFWNALSFPAAWIVAHDQNAPKAAAMVYLFPLVGLGMVAGAIYTTIRWRKFGRTRFVPSSLPGVIGGYLGGMIEVPARVVPEGEAQLKLQCVRREVRRSGKNRTVTDVLLWEREEAIAREKWVTGLGGTQIPVLFYIPATCVGTDDSDTDNKIVWKLSAGVATSGVDFATQFEVPVFATGETALPPEAGRPLLAEYSIQPLDEGALRKCGVRRTIDGFHFSASHLPGTKFTTALLSLGILALLVWYARIDAHGAVWGITLFFGFVISLFAVGVWFASYELRVEGSDVVVTKPRPWGTKVTRVPREEVRLVKHAKSMASGESQYFSLSLVGPEAANATNPLAGESFLARKLRHRLEQMQQQGKTTPEKMKQLEAELAARLGPPPKFTVQFAAHIPGHTKAEAIGAMVLSAIRGEK